MRRKHLRLLANCTRLLLLGTCCAAGGTAAVWNWRPEWVDATGDWLQKKFVVDYRKRLMAIGNDADGKRQVQRYQQLLGELEPVRRQDRLADVKDECMAQLGRLAEGANDLAAAVQWARERVDFDDHNVLVATRLADLECRVPSLRSVGLERLSALAKGYPGHPFIVTALAQNLANDGRPSEAARALDTACQALRSNLWTIVWDAGSGIDRNERRVETIPVRDGDQTTLRFRIAEPIVGMSIAPPPFHSGLIEQPRLECGPGRTIDLTDAQTTVFQMRTELGRMATFGDSGAYLTAHWQTPIPADTPLVLHWRDAPMPELAFAAAFVHPALGAWLEAPAAPADAELVGRIRRGRARACASGDFQLFWCLQNEALGPRNQIVRPVAVPDQAGATFTARFLVDGNVDRLRLDLPEGVGGSYALSTFELQAGERTIPIDLQTVELLAPNSVVRRGGQFLVTGKDPFFSLALPQTLTVGQITLAGASR